MIRRHSLVWLSSPPVSNKSSSPVEAWFEAGNPFMICRTRPGEDLSLGFCLPQKAGEPGSPRRFAAHGKRADIQQILRPPEIDLLEAKDHRQDADATWHWLPANDPKNSASHMLRVGISPEGCSIRLIGSRMWQFLTGVQYASENSDMDAVMDIPHARLLDEAAACLKRAQDLSPCKLDAEISIPLCGEVHWKEWLSDADPVLVKSVDSVALHPRKWISNHSPA